MGSDKGPCLFPGCDRSRKYLKYCDGHQAQLRSGRQLRTLQVRRGASVADRLEHWSMPLTESGCIVWMGSVRDSPDGGYGSLKVGGSVKRVSRLAYELHAGPIPEGVLIDHRCGVRSCINPDHLRLATPSQNAAHLTKMNRRNTSGYRNVYWHEPTETWQVLIGSNGRTKSYGMYSDIEDAARVAREKRREIYGEFAGKDT